MKKICRVRENAFGGQSKSISKGSTQRRNLFSDILRDIYTPVTDGWSSLDCVMQESTEKIDFLKYMTKQVFPEEEDYFLKQMGK